MALREILEHRRSIRHYDAEKTIDTEQVKACLELATLAPTSSNMQLWECYHITDKTVMKALTKACLNQQSAATAKKWWCL